MEIVDSVATAHHIVWHTVMEYRRVALDTGYRSIQIATPAIFGCYPHVQERRVAENVRRQVSE